jgi:hypothetical protein
MVWRTAIEDETTCRDCISLSEALVIGDPEGPGYHQESQWVTRDSLGRYWVGNVDGQKVYGAAGQFLGHVGRSGEGPLEFRGVGPIYTDQKGRVHVFDQRNRRESVITPDFRLYSERPLPWGPVYDAAPLPGGDRIVVNGVFRAPDQIGLPLHIIDDTSVVKSFGMVERGSYGVGTMHMLRRITTDGDGVVFSAGFFEYSVDVWNAMGERLLGFKRPGLWEPPPGGQPHPLSVETNLWGLILALAVVETDRLWVITWVPRQDWHSNVAERRGPDGKTYLEPVNSNASLYRTAVDVIDLKSGRVLAHSLFDELIYGFLGMNSLFGNRFSEAGEPRLVVWKVRVAGQLDREED